MLYHDIPPILRYLWRYRQPVGQSHTANGGSMPLTDTFIKNVKPGAKPAGDKYTDGGGMYLLVNGVGKYWRMNYRFANKRKTMAFGVYPDVSLAKARARRDKARELLADGIDPGLAKKAEKRAKTAASANTFQAVAEQWLKATAAKRAAVTQDKVANWLKKDIYPHIGAMPISDIGPRDVLAAGRKMEARQVFDSAKRIIQICGQVFRYAVAEGTAERDVTGDLRGALQQTTTKNYAAIIEPKLVGDLMRSIFGYTGHLYTVAALKLSPLLFVRPGELRKAEWTEIDLDGAEWRIPATKMKMKIEHIVPLSRQAVEILRELHPVTGHGRYVFPSLRTGERPMSENTVNAALRGMGYSAEAHTAHGFRATARTILDEVLGERVDLIEHQLAHAVKDANGRAYNRTAHLPARRDMMQRWAAYLDKLRIGADVIQLRAAV